MWRYKSENTWEGERKKTRSKFYIVTTLKYWEKVDWWTFYSRVFAIRKHTVQEYDEKKFCDCHRFNGIYSFLMKTKSVSISTYHHFCVPLLLCICWFLMIISTTLKYTLIADASDFCPCKLYHYDVTKISCMSNHNLIFSSRVTLIFSKSFLSRDRNFML